MYCVMSHMSKHASDTCCLTKATCGEIDWLTPLIQPFILLCLSYHISTCCDFDPWLSAAVSGAPHQKGDMRVTNASPQGGTVSVSMLALRCLAFKERPPGPPPTVLLNKQGWLSADHNHWEKMKSSLGGRDVITLPVVHLFYVSGSVYRFEGSYFDYNL